MKSEKINTKFVWSKKTGTEETKTTEIDKKSRIKTTTSNLWLFLAPGGTLARKTECEQCGACG